MDILILVYWILAYMALNKVWYSKREYIVFDGFSFYLKKIIISAVLGWALIPIATIMIILGK